MIVEHADAPQSHHLRNAHRLFPALGIDLPILTAPRLPVVSDTISTIHVQGPNGSTTLLSTYASTHLSYLPNGDKYTLSLFESNWVVRHGSEVTRVPVASPSERPPLYAQYRRDKAFAVWDDRGLTIRAGKLKASTRLPAVSVTPKLFTPDEIHNTVSLVHVSKRRKEADALSGSRRIGRNAYFLVRWDGSDGKPWLEALIKVDLAANHPSPILLGRFEGLSTSTRKVDDKLFLSNGKLAVATRRAHDWGIATYSPADDEFEFHSEGANLVSLSDNGLFIGRTSYGTTVGGRYDDHFAASRLFEDRGFASWLDALNPPLALTHSPESNVIRNCETGAELPMSEKAVARRVLGVGFRVPGSGGLVVIWSPLSTPKQGYLYDPSTWQRLAKWPQ